MQKCTPRECNEFECKFVFNFTNKKRKMQSNDKHVSKIYTFCVRFCHTGLIVGVLARVAAGP